MASDAYAALRIPDYRRFLSMRLLMTLSIQIMSVSVGYFIFELTNDPLAIGMIGLSEAIPAIVVSLWAGHLADKYNRRNLLLFCIGLFVFCAFALFGLILSRDFLEKSLLIAGIYGVIFITGIARGFFSPTNFAFLPQLVPPQVLPNALTWNSSTWEAASITGLGIGGLLYGFLGVSTAFGVMSALCLAAFLVAMRIKPRPVPALDRQESALQRIAEGLSFVFRNKLILSAIALDLFAVLFGGAVAMLPVYAKDILKVGPQGMGVLRAAMSIGAISMAFFIAHRPLGKGSGKIMLACVAGFGLCIIGFGLSRSFWLSFFLLLLAGMFDEVSVYIRGSIIQLLTPERMKGRVSSVNSIFITSSNELGSFESGVAARAFGNVYSVVFGGCMTLLITGLAWWLSPPLRNLDVSTLKETDQA